MSATKDEALVAVEEAVGEAMQIARRNLLIAKYLVVECGVDFHNVVEAVTFADTRSADDPDVMRIAEEYQRIVNEFLSSTCEQAIDYNNF